MMRRAKLRGPEVWSRDLIASRLAWKPETPITVIELRVSTLPPADAGPMEATATEAQLNGIEEFSNRNSGYELPPNLVGRCRLTRSNPRRNRLAPSV